MTAVECPGEPRETPAAFARRLGVSRQRVNAMLAQGLPRDGDLLIPVAEALAWVRANVDPVRSRAQRRSNQRAHGEAERRACPACGSPVAERPPFVPEPILRERNPTRAGYLLAAHAVMCRAERTVGAMALAAGASVPVAWATAQLTVAMLAAEIEQGLKSDQPWLDTRFVEEPDWREAARVRGEPFEPERWQKQLAERMAAGP